ncbi:methyltransferase domain-containing protein [Aeromicrobium sp. CF3.5]|uniref:methyltransferase domain-containing protein n=1 Tax=Aeromicrobium sp. CF3.5 TaxID=3373078 RepID=UPI003EE7913D
MSSWNPSQYLQFADERGRPFVDLVSRIGVEASSVVDLGCGPGQLTPVLRARFPEADILGVDSSAEMIERAEAENADPRARYEASDVAEWQPGGPIDVLTSNALFQWVPRSFGVIERLAAHVSPGGAFAIQTPHNFDAPSHRLLHEISSAGPFAEHTEGLHEDRGTESAADYLALFAGLGWSVDAWETEYQHVLPGEDPVFEWISGTSARPILQALPDGLRSQFVREYKTALREAFPRRDFGTVLPFARVFCVAVKPWL